MSTTTVEPRGAYDREGAAAYLSIGLTKLRQLVRDKEIQKVSIGGAPRYTRKSLDAYIARQERRSA